MVRKLTHLPSIVGMLLVISTAAVSAQEATPDEDAKKAAMLFEMGAHHLQDGDADKAITLLEMAVQLEQKNVRYSHALATAYYKTDRVAEFWTEIRRAVRIDVTYEPAVNDFLAIWKFHDSKRLTNMGVDVRAVRTALGKPDDEMQNSNLIRLVYGFKAIDFRTNGKLHRVVDLRGLPNDVFDYNDEVWISFDDRKWQAGHQEVNRHTLNTEFVLAGQVVQDWSELVSHQRMFYASRGQTPRQIMERIRKLTRQAVPDVVWAVLAESDNDVMYEWRTKGSDEQDAQHEIARLIAGERDVHRVAYVAKGEELDPDKRETWMKIIKSVNLTKGEQKKRRAVTIDPKQIATDALVWNLGKNLSTAALMNARQGDAELQSRSFAEAARAAEALGVELPELPKAEADENGNIAAMIGYLIPTMGKALGAKLSTRDISMYSVAVKSSLLPLLYADEKSRESLAGGIEGAVGTAQLPPTTWQPLLSKVKAGVPGREVALAVLKMHKSIDAYLALAAEGRPTPSATPSKGLSGTFALRLGDSTWELVFDNGTVFVRRDGKQMVESAYKVEGDKVTFTDRGGALSTKAVGSYTWKLGGDQLTFRVIEDDAGGRRQVLTTAPWTAAR